MYRGAFRFQRESLARFVSYSIQICRRGEFFFFWRPLFVVFVLHGPPPTRGRPANGPATGSTRTGPARPQQFPPRVPRTSAARGEWPPRDPEHRDRRRERPAHRPEGRPKAQFLLGLPCAGATWWPAAWVTQPESQAPRSCPPQAGGGRVANHVPDMVTKTRGPAVDPEVDRLDTYKALLSAFVSPPRTQRRREINELGGSLRVAQRN